MGRSVRGAVPEGCDVQECDLVGSLLEVSAGQLDGLSEVTDISSLAVGCRLLTDIVLVALGDNKVSLVVGTDIQAGDNAFRELVLCRFGDI